MPDDIDRAFARTLLAIAEREALRKKDRSDG